MDNKEYTTTQEQLARFAKAMGHPARMAILEFLIKQNTCFLALPILSVFERQDG